MKRPMTERRLRRMKRRIDLVFALLLAATAAAAAVPASKLIAAYRDWRRIVWTQSTDIPLEGLPAIVTVTVYYDTEPPKSPILADPVTGKDLGAMCQESDGSIALSVDLPQDFGDALRLTLHPGNNGKLDYGVSIGPSRTYIGCEASLTEDADGHVWLDAETSCPFSREHGEPIKARLIITGKLREPAIWEADLDTDGRIHQDVTALIDLKGYGLLPGEHVKLFLSAMPDNDGSPSLAYDEEFWLENAVPEYTADSE